MQTRYTKLISCQTSCLLGYIHTLNDVEKIKSQALSHVPEHNNLTHIMDNPNKFL